MIMYLLIAVIAVIQLLGGGSQTDVFPVVPLNEYENNILDSGGDLLKEQAALDIHFYELDLTINPFDSTIAGSVRMHSRVLYETETYVAHLDTLFDVHHVHYQSDDTSVVFPLAFTHSDGLVIAQLPEVSAPGSTLTITVTYTGKPRMAPNPPWEGGFTWAWTDDGKPWIGVSCQVNGADIWWPVKDHPSDRPDSVSLKFTVPDSVTAVSNGLLRSVEQRSQGTKTYHWVTNYPISNYAVTVNVGPYIELERTYKSITGETFPVYFWALPQHKVKAEQLLDQIDHQMRFLEDLLGPYPYRNEKYGVVEAPFFGMEHQTIIAYGAGYKNDTVFDTDSGFDDLHHHELSHEWWGNYVTAYDWKDFWIHEGFGTYMQPLYAEHLHGKEHYRYFMKRLYQRILNNIPVAPSESRTTREMFEGRDIYMKGAWVLHTLRKMIGDESFFAALREMVYPRTTERQNYAMVSARFTDTQDFIRIVEKISDRKLDWFFTTYLRYSDLPILEKRWVNNSLILSWSTPSNQEFPMPVEVCDGTHCTTVIPDGKTPLTIQYPDRLVIDPYNRVLRSGLYHQP